jgi:hypothetical protein
MSSNSITNLNFPTPLSSKKIFRIRKYKRDGLLEKKLIIKENQNIQLGRWTREEHQKFIRACLKHGKRWQKVNKAL